MLIIPAIDIRNGKCVRLRQGEIAQETVYSDDPVAKAKEWVAAGAQRLHVVDLDGAFTGEPKNLETIIRIKAETGVHVQMGGGLREEAAIEKALSGGVDSVILGTVIFEQSDLAARIFQRFDGRVMVALDAKEGMIATRGWKESSSYPVPQALDHIASLGCQEAIYTDVGRDGTLEGVNTTGIERIMSITAVKIYASGGVATLDDIRRLKAINSPGCIVGKAIYEGKLDLAEAIRTAS